jgi:hypothetical protein
MLASTASSFGHATTGIQYEKFSYDIFKIHFVSFLRAKDQKNFLKYLLTTKNKLARPRVKYQVHFLFYLIFLCLLSYLVLFVKPSLIELNEKITFFMENGTCSQDDLYCSPPTPPLKQSWSFLQLIINIWVFMFALEEFRQVRKGSAGY